MGMIMASSGLTVTSFTASIVIISKGTLVLSFKKHYQLWQSSLIARAYLNILIFSLCFLLEFTQKVLVLDVQLNNFESLAVAK